MSVTWRLTALVVGFCLDLLLGDPQWAPHPVRAIGGLIGLLERPLRRVFPKSPGGELAAGGVLVLLILAIPTALTAGALWACGRVSVWLAFAEVCWRRCCAISFWPRGPCGPRAGRSIKP